jgi:hypothetical protein
VQIEAWGWVVNVGEPVVYRWSWRGETRSETKIEAGLDLAVDVF